MCDIIEIKAEKMEGYMTGQIINANIVLPDRVLSGGVCRFTDGVIDYIGCDAVDGIPTVDAEGKYLFAGFVDIHCHGGGGYDFMDATPDEMIKISKFHLSHGTTTLVATTMTDADEAIFAALDRFAEIPEESRLTLHGVHLEGPWLSPAQCGAQDVSKMSKPTAERLRWIKEKYPFVERVSVAPEVEGGLEVGRAGQDMGLVMAIAHTDADYDMAVLAADNGYSLMTHHYSGMKGVVRVNAYRVAGCIEAGLVDDRFTCEVIADGKHLPAGLLKLIYKCKSADRICLITDGMRGAGLPDGEETMLGRMNDGVKCIIEDGVAKLPDRQSFAGSVATTERLFRTMRELAEVDFVDLSKMLSLTPARVMGYEDRGSIEIGKRADLLIIDENLKINKIFLKGAEYAS